MIAQTSCGYCPSQPLEISMSDSLHRDCGHGELDEKKAQDIEHATQGRGHSVLDVLGLEHGGDTLY